MYQYAVRESSKMILELFMIATVFNNNNIEAPPITI